MPTTLAPKVDKMEYTVTVQNKGLLVCASCFNTEGTVINNSPMTIAVLDQDGITIWAVRGFVSRDGEFQPMEGM
jgi:hypothetical protein